MSENCGPIIIVGMHRSGTSVLSSIIHKLGVDLGTKLLESSFANPTGHYEDVAFLDLHERILHGAKGDWDSPPTEDRLKESFERLESDVDTLLEQRNRCSASWGWKEPRTSLLLPFYFRKLPHLRLIYCQRDPEEVAQSISARNAISIRYARKLVRCYEERIQAFLKDNPNVSLLSVEYRKLIREPRAIASILAGHIGLSVTESDLDFAVSDVLSRREVRSRSRQKRRGHLIILIQKAIRNPGVALRVINRASVRYIRRKKWNIEQ